MATSHTTPEDKDQLLREAFGELNSRGISSAWTQCPRPYTDLRGELVRLAGEPEFAKALRSYLRTHTGLIRALTMLFTYIATSATARWQEEPAATRGIAARGWFLGRWVPTFLILDGPIGRFLNADDSPVQPWVGKDYPLFTAAREFLAQRLFRLLRNGFAHWAFDWDVIEGESYIVAYDWERDLPTAKMHQSECDAYHIAAFALVELINDVLLSQHHDTPAA